MLKKLLLSEITGLYRKYNFTGDLYNRACILSSFLERYAYICSVSVNKNNLLEFTIKHLQKTLIITFKTAEDLRCTINSEEIHSTFNRGFINKTLESLKGDSNESKVEDRRNSVYKR